MIDAEADEATLELRDAAILNPDGCLSPVTLSAVWSR
jgi:hypothetical protein